MSLSVVVVPEYYSLPDILSAMMMLN